MKQITVIFFVLISSIGYTQQMLTPEQLQEDFAEFKKELYKRNKGLHLFVSEEDLANHLKNIEQQLTAPKTTFEFQELLQKAIIPVGERHLSINGFHKKSAFAERLNKKDSTAVKLFPLYVYFKSDDEAYVLRNAHRDSSVQLPSRLLSVNGKKVNQLRTELAQYITQDNGVTTWRNWEISQKFPLSYYSHIDTTSTFVIEWQDSLKSTQVDTLQGLSRKVYRDSLKKQSKAIYGVEKLKPSLRYELYDAKDAGYLKIGSFKANKQKFEKETIKYKHVVSEFFEKVEEKQLDNVIIDLRNNTGGSVRLLQYLFAYIQPEDEKTPIFSRLKNRDFWWGEVEREEKTGRQRKPHFDGQVYILTNGGSYSASVMFAVYAKKMANAIVVGEPAGGRPTGTTAGSFHIERLKHSDILVRIPESVFYYDKDGAVSIAPDVYVQPKVEDFFSYDSDFQLETVLQLIADEQ